MEDGPCKPDPFPVRSACERLGVPSAQCVMVGDTPDDVASARAAGCVGIGVLTPEEHAKAVLGVATPEGSGMAAPMLAAGAAEVQPPGLAGLLDWFPPAALGATRRERVGVCGRGQNPWRLLTFWRVRVWRRAGRTARRQSGACDQGDLHLVRG